LFPSNHILADAYRLSTDEEGWKKIEAQRYVRLSPLYLSRRHIDTFIPDEPLPEKEEKGKKVRHRTKEPVDVSAIAFLEEDGTGLDTVRKAKARAIEFLKMLITFAMVDDSTAFEIREAACECGDTHRHYRASWLIPMWNRKWVPLGDGKQSP